jgi:cell division protein FtsN
MPGRAPTVGDRLKESLRYWAVVAVVCGVVGLGGYAFGKGWLGARLHEMELSAGAPEISADVSVREAMATGASEDSPPAEPVIEVQEREPSGRERREAERELAAQEPQDGAELHAREAEREQPEREQERPAEAEAQPPAEPRETSTSASETERYVVTAGAYADERNARSVMRGLASQGYHPYATTIVKDGLTFQRVNVAVFGTREQAEKLAGALQAQGFAAAVRPG